MPEKELDQLAFRHFLTMAAVRPENTKHIDILRRMFSSKTGLKVNNVHDINIAFNTMVDLKSYVTFLELALISKSKSCINLN